MLSKELSFSFISFIIWFISYGLNVHSYPTAATSIMLKNLNRRCFYTELSGMLKSRWTENDICSVSFCLCIKYTNRNFTGIKYCFVLQNRKFVIEYIHFLIDAGWSSLVARRAHNPKVVGSNPAPATIFIYFNSFSSLNLFQILYIWFFYGFYW